MKVKINYTFLKEEEHHFLKEMLYQAIFVSPGTNKFAKSILEEPSLKKYFESWNRNDGDIAIVAVHESQLVGAVWGRKFKPENKGFGYIDENTPEISMAVLKNYRGQQIGTDLLKQIENEYFKSGVDSISLSVDKRNPAVSFYKRAGYIFYEDHETAITMVKKLNNK